MTACPRSRLVKSMPRGGRSVRTSCTGPSMNFPLATGPGPAGNGHMPAGGVTIAGGGGPAGGVTAVEDDIPLLEFDAMLRLLRPLPPRPVNVTAMITARRMGTTAEAIPIISFLLRSKNG